MKILMVSSFLPYPLFSGGQVRLYNIIKELSKRHEITLVCEIRPNQTQDDIKEMEKYCKKVLTVKRKKQWTLKNIIETGLSKNSFLITNDKKSKNFFKFYKFIYNIKKFNTIKNNMRISINIDRFNFTYLNLKNS